MAQSNSKPPIGQNFGLGGLHSKSSAQSLSYGNNGFPPFSPLPQSESSLASSPSVKDASMEEIDVSSRGPSLMLGSSSSFIERKFISNFDSLPPRGHRRANSDVPLGFDAFIQTTPQLVPVSNIGVFGKGGSFANDKSVFDKAMDLEKHEKDMIRDGKSISDGVEERKCEGEVIDGFFSSYMNLDMGDRCHVSGGEDNEKGSLIHGGSRRSLDKEGDILSMGNVSNIHGMTSREPNKRSADGDLAPATRHFRSLSVDSAFGNLNFGNESPDLADGRHMGQFLPANSANENSAKFSLGFGNGEFTESELKRIQADERLAEIAFSDPKRVKRILANRQSAARSKERKMRYITELEHKVQTLQTEATTLSAQLTTLQKDIRELTNHNSELKFRLKSMDQQARLRDALHEALAAEVKHLKLAAMEKGQDGGGSTRISQQTPIKHQMLHMDCQQFSAGTSKSATNTSSPTPASA